jgi:hypothetical protein
MASLTDELRTAPTTFRPFRPDPIKPAALRAALRHARLASWRLVTITDRATREAIRDAHLPHWRAYLTESGGARIIAADAPARQAHELRLADAFARELHEAPVHLVLLGRRGAALRTSALADLAGALRGEGMDAAPVPLAARADAELRQLLALEDHVRLDGILVARAVR